MNPVQRLHNILRLNIFLYLDLFTKFSFPVKILLS